MYKKNTIVISSFLSFLILISFIRYYTIPPLIDFQAHITFGMIKEPFLSPYYHYQPALTYRFLDGIVRFWHFFIGNHYAKVALASYLTVLFYIYSVIYTFCLLCEISYKRAFCLTSIVSGPIFLLLHSLMFFWGVIPFVLSLFMVTASSVALWCIDNEVTQKSLRLKTCVIFIIYTLLAIYSHPSGFLFLGITWVVPAMRFFFISGERTKRFVFFSLLFITLMLTAYWVMSSLEMRNTPTSLFPQLLKSLTQVHYMDRVQWLLQGGPYHDLVVKVHFLPLIPLQEAGIFGDKVMCILLTLIPFIVLLALLFLICKRNNLKKNDTSLLLFLIAQLIIAFIMIIIVPRSWGELSDLYQRYWLLVCAWTWMGMVYLLNRTSEKIFRLCCYLSPLGVILSCILLQPIYSHFREIPIELVAKRYSHSLLNAVTIFRQEHPALKQKTIVVYYKGWPVERDWFIYRIVPFIMLNSIELANNHIIIKNTWSADTHLPIVWNGDSEKNANIQLLYWKNTKAHAPITLAINASS